MHQSDYCMQTSVLKLSDTKKGTNVAVAFSYSLAFFRVFFSCQMFLAIENTNLGCKKTQKTNVQQQSCISVRGRDQRSHSNV